MTVKGKTLVPSEINVQPLEGPAVCIFFETDVDGFTNGTTLLRGKARALAAVMRAAVGMEGMDFEVRAEQVRFVQRDGKARFEYSDGGASPEISVRLDQDSVMKLAKEIENAADTLVDPEAERMSGHIFVLVAKDRVEERPDGYLIDLGERDAAVIAVLKASADPGREVIVEEREASG